MSKVLINDKIYVSTEKMVYQTNIIHFLFKVSRLDNPSDLVEWIESPYRITGKKYATECKNGEYSFKSDSNEYIRTLIAKSMKLMNCRTKNAFEGLVRIYTDNLIKNPSSIDENFKIEVFRNRGTKTSYNNNERRKIKKISEKKLREIRKIFYKMSPETILYNFSRKTVLQSIFYSNIAIAQIHFTYFKNDRYIIGVVPIFLEKNKTLNGKKMVVGNSSLLYDQPLMISFDQLIFYKATKKLNKELSALRIGSKPKLLPKPITVVKVESGIYIYYRCATTNESKQYHEKYYQKSF